MSLIKTEFGETHEHWVDDMPVFGIAALEMDYHEESTGDVDSEAEKLVKAAGFSGELAIGNL